MYKASRVTHPANSKAFQEGYQTLFAQLFIKEGALGF